MATGESLEHQIARLEAELVVANNRAVVAETQLWRVREGVRAFKEKQEQLARARKAREAQRAPVVAASSLVEADPSLDARLDKYLESSFEPDRSREWMLEE